MVPNYVNTPDLPKTLLNRAGDLFDVTAPEKPGIDRWLAYTRFGHDEYHFIIEKHGKEAHLCLLDVKKDIEANPDPHIAAIATAIYKQELEKQGIPPNAAHFYIYTPRNVCKERQNAWHHRAVERMEDILPHSGESYDGGFLMRGPERFVEAVLLWDNKSGAKQYHDLPMWEKAHPPEGPKKIVRAFQMGPDRPETEEQRFVMACLNHFARKGPAQG